MAVRSVGSRKEWSPASSSLRRKSRARWHASKTARFTWMLHYTCAPIIGGVESIITEHARLLRYHGYRVSLVAGRGAPDVLLPEIDSLHPAVLAVQDELDAGHVSQAFEALRSRIRKALAEKLSGPGVPTAPTVLAHNAFTFHKNLALTAALADLAREGRARFIAWCHDLAWTNPLYLSMLHDGMPWDLLRTPCPGVTYVAISRERQRELTGLFGWPTEKVGCVPNGIDATRFLSASDTMRLLLKRLDWHGRDMVLLAPARMTPRKNLEMAIGVVAELKATGQYPLLVVTGPPDPHSSGQDYAGFLREECRRLRVEEDVCFLSQVLWLPGGVSDELMAELYRWADALIFPSRQEGFGLPILEGGLARLPIFCSDLPVLREIGGEDAHYFSPDSPPASVAALIHAALTAPGPAALRRRVLEEYGWEAIYREQLEPLLSKGGTVYGKHIIVA